MNRVRGMSRMGRVGKWRGGGRPGMSVSAPFGMSLREPAKFDEFGLGRFQGQAELSQPFAQGVLDAYGILSILEAHHKVVDVSDHVGLSPQPGFDHALEP